MSCPFGVTRFSVVVFFKFFSVSTCISVVIFGVTEEKEAM
jgi:hypothetical protein